MRSTLPQPLQGILCPFTSLLRYNYSTGQTRLLEGQAMVCAVTGFSSPLSRTLHFAWNNAILTQFPNCRVPIALWLYKSPSNQGVHSPSPPSLGLMNLNGMQSTCAKEHHAASFLLCTESPSRHLYTASPFSKL